MCSAEMQASMRRWRWRWRMREPPAAAPDASAVLLVTSVIAFPAGAAHAAWPVLHASLSRTIARGGSGEAQHETDLASGPLAHHPAAAAVPARILPHSVCVRFQDQLRRSRTSRPSL